MTHQYSVTQGEENQFVLSYIAISTIKAPHALKQSEQQRELDYGN